MRNSGLRTVKVSDILPNPKNFRTHDQMQRDAFEGTVKEIGWYGYPDVFEHPDHPGKLMLVDGELRQEHLAERYGKQAVIEVNVTDFTPEEADIALATKDPISGLAGVAGERLDQLLNDIRPTNSQMDALFETLRLSAFDNMPKPDRGDPDDVPDLVEPEEAITQPGDVWLLGRHRVMCGDSTNAEDVAKLMGRGVAVLCLTDPPYSVDYDRSQSERGGNESAHSPYKEGNINPCDILEFMGLVTCDVMIWSYPIDRHFSDLFRSYVKYGWEFRKELVWVKDSFSFWMSAKYQQKHEPIMLAVKSGKPIGGSVPSNASTVFEFPRPTAHKIHPTAKPCELWSQFVSNHSKTDEIIYDPFLGSGTTLIAAEQLGRICYGMEISPVYCDCTVKRWEQFTGETAVKET